MGPDGIPARRAASLGQPAPDGRGLAEPAWPQFQADQGGERPLGRAAGRAAAANRLGECGRCRQPLAGGVLHHRGDPSLDERERGLETGERRLLPGCLLRPEERATGHASCSASGLVMSICVSDCRSCEVSMVMPLAYSSTAPNRCARSHGTWAKSRWCAASRSARKSLTSPSGTDRPAPNAATLAGIKAAVPSGPTGRPTSVELTTSSASAPTAWPVWLATTRPPICRTRPAWARPWRAIARGDRRRHHRGHRRALQPRGLGARGQRATHGLDRLGGDGVAQLGPDRNRRLDPLRTAPCHGVAGAGWERGDVVEPQVGEPQSLGDLLGLRGEDARVALRGYRVPRHVGGEIPVHGPALPRHQVGELPQGVGELLRVAEHRHRVRLARRAARPGTAGLHCRLARALVRPAGRTRKGSHPSV